MDVEPYNKIWLNYFLPIAVDSRCQSLEFQNEIDQFKFFFRRWKTHTTSSENETNQKKIQK